MTDLRQRAHPSVRRGRRIRRLSAFSAPHRSTQKVFPFAFFFARKSVTKFFLVLFKSEFVDVSRLSSYNTYGLKRETETSTVWIHVEPFGITRSDPESWNHFRILRGAGFPFALFFSGLWRFVPCSTSRGNTSEARKPGTAYAETRWNHRNHSDRSRRQDEFPKTDCAQVGFSSRSR